MVRSLTRFLSVLLLLGSLAGSPAAVAVQSYDSCTGFIDSIPTTITTQGVWCLRQHLSTSITSGNAIRIATNNVTIDCNDFRVGGLAAGKGSLAWGIHASNRQNSSVRDCNIRGFHHGILINGGAGHLVQDNRLDNNLHIGIRVHGDNSRIVRNVIYSTGGGTGTREARGIDARADIVDNTVSGLFADFDSGVLYGIGGFGAGTLIRGNTVSAFNLSAVQGGEASFAYGIILHGSGMRASDNHVDSGGDAVPGIGIYTDLAVPAYCLGNTVGGFTTPIDGGCASSNNLTLP